MAAAFIGYVMYEILNAFCMWVESVWDEWCLDVWPTMWIVLQWMFWVAVGLVTLYVAVRIMFAIRRRRAHRAPKAWVVGTRRRERFAAFCVCRMRGIGAALPRMRFRGHSSVGTVAPEVTVERAAELPAGSGLTYAEFLARTPGLVHEATHAEREGAS